MGTGYVKFSVDIGVYQGNDPLVLGQLDFEAIIYSGYHTYLPFQLSVHIYPVARLQIELVAVVSKALIPDGEAYLYNGFPGCGFCWGCIGRLPSIPSSARRVSISSLDKSGSFSFKCFSL